MILARSGWQTINIGDITNTLGLLAIKIEEIDGSLSEPLPAEIKPNVVRRKYFGYNAAATAQDIQRSGMDFIRKSVLKQAWIN